MTRILVGDALERLRELPDGSVHCCVTSPPYWGLRSYEGGAGMIGLEPTFDEHLSRLVAVFREVRRVLRPDGTCWLNYGDAYAGSWGAQSRAAVVEGPSARQMRAAPKGTGIGSISRTPGLKPKDLMMMPARVALALQQPHLRCRGCEHVAHALKWGMWPNGRRICPGCEKSKGADVETPGWWVRSEIVWHKPNPMPESCTDRPTSAHEKLFLLTKAARYFYDADAVRVQGGNGWHGTFKARSDERRDGDGKGGEERTGGANLRNVWTIPTHSFSGWTQTVDLVRIPASEAREHAESGSGAGGDTARTTSPCCPVHAGQPDRVPTGFCDGLQDDQIQCMRGNGGRPGRASPDADSDSAPIPDQHQPDLSMLDCSGPEDSHAAMRRSSGTHRMDPSASSSQRATPSEERQSSIARTEPSPPEIASTSQSTAESRTAADTPPSHSQPRTADGSARTSQLVCSCSYYTKVVTKMSHFATFPPALVEPCILSGTSARGVCATCGAPWARETERTGHVNGREPAHVPGNTTTKTDSTGWAPTTRATDVWSPSCECNAATVPATVLDPFGGSGTVALVAERLQRDAILIEISATYAQMAEQRIREDAPLLTGVTMEVGTL